LQKLFFSQIRQIFIRYFSSLLSILIVFINLATIFKLSIIPAYLAVVLLCLLFYFVPGLLIWDTLFHKENISFIEIIPYCFALSFSWLVLMIGIIGVFLSANLATVVFSIYLSIAALLLINFTFRYGFSTPSILRTTKSQSKSLPALIILVSIVLMFLFYGGGERGVDSWKFLSTAQEFLRIGILDLRDFSSGFNNSYALPIYFLSVGVFAYILSTEVLTVWFYLPLFLTVMSILAVYAFAKTLFKSENITLGCIFVFVILFFYWRGYRDRPFFLFAHLTTPDSFNNYILFPLFLAASIRWGYQRSWALKWFALLLSISTSMAILHNSQYFYAVTVLLFIAIVHIIFWQSDWILISKLLVIAVTMIILFVIGFEVAKNILDSSNNLSFISIIENRNTREIINSDYSFPLTSQAGPLYIWGLPVSLLMFFLHNTKSQRIAASTIFIGLFIGGLIYSQPQLFNLAIKTIPKLDRFLVQLNIIFTPLAWGWALTTAMLIIFVFTRRLNNEVKQKHKILFLVILSLVLIGSTLVYFEANDFVTWLILYIYPSKYYIFFTIALFFAVLSSFLTRNHTKSSSAFLSRVFALKLGEQPVAPLMLLLALFLLIIPTQSIPHIQSKSPDPNVIITNEFGEEVKTWWEPELLSFLNENLPANSTILTQCWPQFFLNPLVKQHLIYNETLFTAFDPRVNLTTYVDALHQNQVEYILLTNGQSSWFTDCSDDRDIMIKNFKFLLPILSQFPQVFEKVYSSSSNVLFKVSIPYKDTEVSKLHWKEYQNYLEQDDADRATNALQLWALYSPDQQQKCRAQELATPLVTKRNDGLNINYDNPGIDVAVIQAGTSLTDVIGFSLRPDRSVYTLIDGNRFNNYAVTYAADDGIIPCGAKFTVDLGKVRNLQGIELEWARNPAQKGMIEYWTGRDWQPIFDLATGNLLLKRNITPSIATSQVRLSLNTVQNRGEVGIRRLSLYEQPVFVPPGNDVALQSAGTTVEAHSPILHPSLKIEGAIDGNDLDQFGAVVGGPDESYPHWFVLDFNQIRTINALEIQWLDRSYGQDWNVTYYDGENWRKLVQEKNWQPPPNYLYRYILPEPVEGSKIRLEVNWASGGRLALRRFSVYGQ